MRAMILVLSAASVINSVRLRRRQAFHSWKWLHIFLKPLLAPLDEDGGVLPLHGDLVRQYDVSEFFDPEESQALRNVLLSPRGVFRQDAETFCECRLIFCQDCYRALKQKRLPKFAIANGNWFGQLPPNLQNMTYGTLALLRPIQTFGRLV